MKRPVHTCAPDYFEQHSAPAGWYGITLNFQMDGNYKQTPYTVFVDKLNFTYW